MNQRGSTYSSTQVLRSAPRESSIASFGKVNQRGDALASSRPSLPKKKTA